MTTVPVTDSPPDADSGRWWVLLTVGVGTFMSALDGSIVNTFLPVLRTELHTSVAGIEWVTTAYLLVVSGLLLGVGRAGDLYGYKRLYLAGFVLFVIGSGLCGLAPIRAGAGRAAGRAGARRRHALRQLAGHPDRSFPASQRGRALGAQAHVHLSGADRRTVAGRLAGRRVRLALGLLHQRARRALAIALAAALHPHRPAGTHREPFDCCGAVLFGGGLVALLAR